MLLQLVAESPQSYKSCRCAWHAICSLDHQTGIALKLGQPLVVRIDPAAMLECLAHRVHLGMHPHEPFAPGALYEIKVGTDRDAIADICYGVQFAASKDGTQSATVRRTQGREPLVRATGAKSSSRGHRSRPGAKSW